MISVHKNQFVSDMYLLEFCYEYICYGNCWNQSKARYVLKRWLIMFHLHVAQRMKGVVASIAPVASNPLIGFDEVPESPVSVIDFQGLLDFIIPYDGDRY